MGQVSRFPAASPRGIEKDPNSSVFSDEIVSHAAVAPREEEEPRSSLLLPGHLGRVPRSGPEGANALVRHNIHRKQRAASFPLRAHTRPHLMKVLKAALCGLMHSGTRFPCWCSVMKRWINSEEEGQRHMSDRQKVRAVT